MIFRWRMAVFLIGLFSVAEVYPVQGAEKMEKRMPGKIKMFNAETREYEEVDKIIKTEEEWQKELPPDICFITRKKGTERPFTGDLLHLKDRGIFKCAVCGNHLFLADNKFESGTGWPSFFQPVAPENIEERDDFDHGMRRVEVLCRRCGSHLGHVFRDGPAPTGMRYCINSKALEFQLLKSEK